MQLPFDCSLMCFSQSFLEIDRTCDSLASTIDCYNNNRDACVNQTGLEAQFNKAVTDFDIMRCDQAPITTTEGVEAFDCLNTCIGGSGITGILSMSTDCNALARGIECFESNRDCCADELSRGANALMKPLSHVSKN